MANLEPITYQKMTNIGEHNQIINKTNEIVDAINALDIEGIPTLESDVTALKADVGQLKISDAENVVDIAQAQRDISAHASEISAIKVKDVEQDTRITENSKTIDALTKELPTEITLYRDGTGKIRAQVEKEDSTTFDSNTLDMIIPYQYDIISGTTNRSFKLKVSFSDGSTATTNDFVIPEGGGTDVTVTGITLSKDTNNSNKFKASIVLSDSTTIDSGYLEMVTAVSGTFANNKLTIKVNGVESVPITIDTGITYTGGNGITITGGTISIDSTIVALKSDIPDVSGFATKSELNAVDNKVGQIQTAVGDCFNEVSIDGNVLTLTATDGQSNAVTLPSGDWVECNDFDTFFANVNVGSIFVAKSQVAYSRNATAALPIAMSILMPSSMAGEGYINTYVGVVTSIALNNLGKKIVWMWGYGRIVPGSSSGFSSENTIQGLNFVEGSTTTGTISIAPTTGNASVSYSKIEGYLKK